MKVALFLTALLFIIEASTGSLGGFLNLGIGLSIVAGGVIESKKLV